MPRDLWASEVQGKSIHFLRCLASTDWDRFDYYANKIRTLDLHTDDTFGVDETILRQLSTYQPVKRLLPRLESLSLTLGKGKKFPCIEYLPSMLEDSLTRFDLLCDDKLRRGDNDYDHHNSSVQHLLCSLGRCCHNLRAISIPTFVQPPLGTTGSEFTLESFLCQFNSLTTLKISIQDVTPSLMRKIGQLPQLSDLRIGNITDYLWRARVQVRRVPAPMQVSRFTPASFSGCFTQLLSLWLVAVEADDAKIAMNHVSNTLIFLGAFGVHGSAHFTELINPLERFINLISLSLHYSQIDFHPHEGNVNSLTPILSLRKLGFVMLEGFPCNTLTDELLGRIPEAWPNLEFLTLRPRGATSMTLAGLVPISQNCMELRELIINLLCRPFDAKQIGFDRTPSCLCRLDLGCSPVEQPLAVLRCINIMFPRLQVAAANGNPGDPDSVSHKFGEALREAIS